MFGLGSSRNKPLYGAVFDIGSESVGVAIVKSVQDEKYPSILFSHRVHMRITKREQSMTDRIRTMKETLFSASLIISRDGLEALRLHDKHARVSKMLVSCSAPWSYTVSRNVAYEGEEELKISRDLIDDLVQSAENEIGKQLETEGAPSELTYDIVERATIDVRVNDYPILHPIGLKGKAISLAHVTGLIPREVVEALREVEEKVFPGTEIRAHTFMLVMYCVLREIYAEHASMTIVHVTGDTTEFGIVEGDTLVESVSAPVGLESIVRGMMTHDRDTAKEMYSLLELYEKNELNEDGKNSVAKHLTEYAEAVQKSIEGHASTRRFPKTAFVLAPTPFTPLFTTVLSPILKETLGSTGDILTLPLDELGSTPSHDENDANLAITSRFFHKLHGCGEIDPS
jgi:hypothetical protein